MKTAKELCYKAYCYNNPVPPDWNETNRIERFENWWSQNYCNNEQRDMFKPDFNVYIDGKKYIQAE